MKLFSNYGEHSSGKTVKVRLLKNTSLNFERFKSLTIKSKAYKELIAFGGMLVYGIVIMCVMIGAATRDDADSGHFAATIPTVETVVVENQQMVLAADSLVHIAEPAVDQSEVLALAVGIDAVISSVEGGELASDVTMVMVGSTIMNRVDDPRYPDNVEEVLCQPMQFSCFSDTGLKWVGRAAENETFKERCMKAAERVLNGERLLSPQVVYVSSGRQGTVEAQLDGLYFCK